MIVLLNFAKTRELLRLYMYWVLPIDCHRVLTLMVWAVSIDMCEFTSNKQIRSFNFLMVFLWRVDCCFQNLNNRFFWCSVFKNIRFCLFLISVFFCFRFFRFALTSTGSALRMKIDKINKLQNKQLLLNYYRNSMGTYPSMFSTLCISMSSLRLRSTRSIAKIGI